MLTISVVIPIKPGLASQAVSRIASLGWLSDHCELLVAEGTNPSSQRNQAVQQANGAIIYFLDDDSLVTPDALQRLEQHFADPLVVAVGGPSLTPATDSLLQRGIGAVLGSVLGAGGVRNRYRVVGTVRQTTERELILCNLAIRRDAFLAAGGLDERLYPNEENELLDRLKKDGGKLLHDPLLAVERSQRSSIPAFVRQMYRYGRGRAEQTSIAGFNGLMPFAPLAFVIYLMTLPLMPISGWWLPLLVYACAACLCSLRTALQQRQPLFLLLVPPLLPLLHIANGIGLLTGFLFSAKRNVCYNQQAVTIRRMQP
ncbi:MAG: glycosyltransferase family 2 protein [Geobacter sp.]|nr:glycosyltransferase family 2 protein [Geobacter sp.]